ncbi:MAG: hypothetical protein V8S34_02010 [Lawsonibacter sp.]
MLKISIPESLDYDGLFDDLFDQYTPVPHPGAGEDRQHGHPVRAGVSRHPAREQPSKEFLDTLRCRNGNLNIVCGRPATREAL